MVKYEFPAELKDISRLTYADERGSVQSLIEYIKISDKERQEIEARSISFVEFIRNSPHSPIQSFIHEYSLTNEEGVAIMCVAEALLRIPDSMTAKELIRDKLKDKHWGSHKGKSASLLVNASTWGLLLVGGVLGLHDSKNIVGRLINRMGEVVIHRAIKQVIMLISNQFIMGESIEKGLRTAKQYFKKGYQVSFDILGESSRTQAQADYYFKQYINAIEALKKHNTATPAAALFARPNLSVKLSALHPAVMLRKRSRVFAELFPKLIEIAERCKDAGISLSFDAEESYRFDLYMHLLTELLSLEQFKNFNGIGFVIQAYQKRAFKVIDYIINLSNKLGKTIPVRLVKGAYWDSEIKHSQEKGLVGYPVFTAKENTEASYIACAQKMLRDGKNIYPQFATHNARTVATIIQYANGKDFEFQKLQGMGDELHQKVVEMGYKSRIYAPVGKYEDLLAYLMRRLLENGANNSFVNLIDNKKIDIADIVADPIALAKEKIDVEGRIDMPDKIYTHRNNSQGAEPGIYEQLENIKQGIQKFSHTEYIAYSLINGKPAAAKKDSHEVFMPADSKCKIGMVYRAEDKELKEAVNVADKAFAAWSARNADVRAKLLEKVGDILHENRYELYSLLIREAGKNIDDCIAEVREAIDFAYYYANEARRLCGKPIVLSTYTGETNELSLHPKGIFMCISPWNFPLAIFAGQILAALASGNVAIGKPADNTSLIAYVTIKLMHKAGIPADALQLVLAGGRKVSECIITDNRIMGVCFTGSSATAHNINRTLAARDGAIATLIAETGGQNAMIVDSSALPEQATDAIINSAFGSIGQRCSALRVAYIQDEIYDHMVTLLIGAMNELKIGNTENMAIDLGPVINNESRAELQKHIEEIVKVKGCKLVSAHKQIGENDLKDGSFLAPHIIEIKHISDLKQENFGPVLHLRKFKIEDLDAIIDEINSTKFGLAFGIQTRIEERIRHVASRIHSGNFYANRNMIGAHVGVHPFGGENESGTGFKAGGPHYLLKFLYERTLTINTTAIGGNIELLG